jgi:outer membrane protein assembly factor BamA
MEENGFHQSKVTPSEQRDEQQHQVNLTFHVVPGPRALVGEITLEGDAGYSVEEIKEIAKLHSGDRAASNRITRALQRIRRRYQKQNRLLAQVSVASRTYQPKRNTVDYVFKVDRGPVVEIAAEGFKLSQRICTGWCQSTKKARSTMICSTKAGATFRTIFRLLVTSRPPLA